MLLGDDTHMKQREQSFSVQNLLADCTALGPWIAPLIFSEYECGLGDTAQVKAPLRGQFLHAHASGALDNELIA